MTWDREIKTILAFFLLIVPVLLFSRSNPIMIGSCGAFATKPLKPTVACGGNCPTGFLCYGATQHCYPIENEMPGDTCPTGFVRYESTGGQFICIPECLANNLECGAGGACPGGTTLEWNFTDLACKCEPVMGFATDPFDNENIQAAMSGDTCVSKCFTGNVTFSVAPFLCNSHQGDDTICVTINVPVDSCASIDDLINCNLTTGENFLVQLIAQFGFQALFCDDDSDGEIIVKFTRDPSQSTTISMNGVNPIVIPACPAPSLTDPCRCDDPLNIYNGDGSIRLFHDKFIFTGTASSVVDITSVAGTMGVFTDAAGTIPLAIGVIGSTDATGVLEVDFYREPAPSGVVDVMYTIGGVAGPPFMSICAFSATDCPKIPTTSEWGMFTLMLFLMIIGIVGTYSLRTYGKT